MKTKILGSLILASMMATTAFADGTSVTLTDKGGNTSDRKQFQIGFLTGPMIGDDGTNPGMSIGARVEYKPTPLIGLGLFGSYTQFVNQNYFILTSNPTQTLLGAELKLYPFSNDGLYLSGRVGVSYMSDTFTYWDGSTSSASTTNPMLGGAIGYNFKLGQSFSVAPEIGYERIMASPSSVGLVSGAINLNFWI